MDETTELYKEYVSQERDRRRPAMEDVVRTLDRMFSAMPELGIEPQERGPYVWSWRDPGLSPGLEKFYIISMSAMPEAQGYPLLTIRQAIAPRLDSYVTFSCLVIGPDEEDIETSLTTAIVHHTGVAGGVRGTMRKVANEGLAAGLAFAINTGTGRESVSEEDIASGKAIEDIREMMSSGVPDKKDFN